jgi:hypothetical protein
MWIWKRQFVWLLNHFLFIYRFSRIIQLILYYQRAGTITIRHIIIQLHWTGIWRRKSSQNYGKWTLQRLFRNKNPLTLTKPTLFCGRSKNYRDLHLWKQAGVKKIGKIRKQLSNWSAYRPTVLEYVTRSDRTLQLGTDLPVRCKNILRPRMFSLNLRASAICPTVYIVSFLN